VCTLFTGGSSFNFFEISVYPRVNTAMQFLVSIYSY
jgi:hypothetical protein